MLAAESVTSNAFESRRTRYGRRFPLNIHSGKILSSAALTHARSETRLKLVANSALFVQRRYPRGTTPFLLGLRDNRFPATCRFRPH